MMLRKASASWNLQTDKNFRVEGIDLLPSSNREIWGAVKNVYILAKCFFMAHDCSTTFLKTVQLEFQDNPNVLESSFCVS